MLFSVRKRSIQLDEPAYLPVDTGVNLFVRPENIDYALVIDKFFHNISSNEQTDKIGAWNKGPKIGRLVLDFKFFRVEHFLECKLNLVLQVPFAGRFDQTLFDSFIVIQSAISSIF